MNKVTFVAALSAVVVVGVLSGPGWADMGRAPVTEGTIVSGEGGFLYQDGADVNGHGISPAPGTTVDVTLSPEEGWFAAGLIGFANRAPLIAGLPFRRVEAFFLYGETDESVSDSVPPQADITLTSVDGLVQGFGLNTAITSVERRTYEGGLHFEYDQINSPTSSLTWVVSPFVRLSDEDTTTTCGSVCGAVTRTGEVETWLYGVLFAVEPEEWVTPVIALVGRLGAGVYGYDADGDFRSFSGLVPDLFAATVSDGESGVGFRFQIGGGLKFRLGAAANLETFAEADYFSDVGSAQFSTSTDAAGDVSRIDTEDLWELRAGARVTIGLGSTN